jgi:membrane protease YdiL (CAAX protease family)
VKRDYAALAFALVFPTIMTWLYFVALVDDSSRVNPLIMFAFGAGKFVQFTFPLLYVWWFERERIGFTPPSRLGMGPALLFGLIIAAAINVLYFAWLKHSPLLGETTPEKIFGKLKQFDMATPGGFIAMAAAISLVHSLFEEYYWRWFVFGWLSRYVSLAWAIAISSVAFMSHHVIVLAVYFPEQPELVLLLSLSVAVGGGVWAWMYKTWQNLYAVWFSHLLVDIAIMVVGYDMVSKFF